MALAPVQTISATVIDAMLAAGASCDELAIIARHHFPELAPTVDALISAGTEAAIIGALLKAHGTIVARRRAKPSGARRTSKPSTNAAPRRERSAHRGRTSRRRRARLSPHRKPRL
jgi:hypothetical protein